MLHDIHDNSLLDLFLSMAIPINYQPYGHFELRFTDSESMKTL
jgi:hypothetical protein